MDPAECYDRDVDGIGDNQDAFPDNRAEWNDTDNDGLGDNSDQFPNDSKAKYDSDGDGIANYYDTFPDNANMDSWFDLITRIMIFASIAGVGIMVYLRKKKADLEIDKLSYQDDFSMLNQAEGSDIPHERPAGPPPPGSF